MKQMPCDTMVPTIREVIVQETNCIIHPTGYIITKTSDNNLEYHTLHKWYNTRSVPQRINQSFQNESVISLIQMYNDSFQHITFDTLTKLPLIQQIIQKRPDVNILVMNQLQGNMLVKFGRIPPKHICIQPSPNVGYLVKEGWYPHYTGQGSDGLMMGHSRPGGLREYLPSIQKNQYVVYISRRGMSKRVVQNEKELEQILQRWAQSNHLTYKRFVNPKNPDELQKYMRECALFVSVHGGALGNMIWLNQSSKVIEIIPTNSLRERPCFYYLSQALGMDYYNCETIKFDFNQKDSVVDLQSLNTILDTKEIQWN